MQWPSGKGKHTSKNFDAMSSYTGLLLANSRAMLNLTCNLRIEYTDFLEISQSYMLRQ